MANFLFFKKSELKYFYLFLGYMVRAKRPVLFRGNCKVFLHLTFFLYPNRLPTLYHYRYSIIHIK